ncbi:MAG: hypothetical protein M1827_002248 [Pycnora praestabilis]|nr:MAG: hypothetical protein M1827_002248 [Pycnora praestabilis]
MDEQSPVEEQGNAISSGHPSVAEWTKLIADAIPTTHAVDARKDPRRTSTLIEAPEGSRPPQARVLAKSPPKLATSDVSASEDEFNISKAKLHGRTFAAITTTDNGERVVAISVRPNGSIRGGRKVRPGYQPVEDKEVYKAGLQSPGLSSRLSRASEQDSKILARQGSKRFPDAVPTAPRLFRSINTVSSSSPQLGLSQRAGNASKDVKLSIEDRTLPIPWGEAEPCPGGPQQTGSNLEPLPFNRMVHNLQSSPKHSFTNKQSHAVSPSLDFDQEMGLGQSNLTGHALKSSPEVSPLHVSRPRRVLSNGLALSDSITIKGLVIQPSNAVVHKSDLPIVSSTKPSKEPSIAFSRPKHKPGGSISKTNKRLWYDGGYVSRLRDPPRYARMSKEKKVEGFHVKGSARYLLVPFTKDCSTAVEQTWRHFIVTSGEMTNSSVRNGVGFTINKAQGELIVSTTTDLNSITTSQKNCMPASTNEFDLTMKQDNLEISQSLSLQSHDSPALQSKSSLGPPIVTEMTKLEAAFQPLHVDVKKRSKPIRDAEAGIQEVSNSENDIRESFKKKTSSLSNVIAVTEGFGLLDRKRNAVHEADILEDPFQITTSLSEYQNNESPPKSQIPAAKRDTFLRMLEDSLGEVEYVKGEGIKRIDEDAITDGQPGSIQPPLDASDVENIVDEPNKSSIDATYSVMAVLTDGIEVRAPKPEVNVNSDGGIALKWMPSLRNIVLSHDIFGDEGLAVALQVMHTLQYCNEPQQIYFEYDLEQADIALHHDILLTMDISSYDFTILVNIFSRYLGGMKVNRKDPEFFLKKTTELRRLVAAGGRKMKQARSTPPVSSDHSSGISSIGSHHLSVSALSCEVHSAQGTKRKRERGAESAKKLFRRSADEHDEAPVEDRSCLDEKDDGRGDPQDFADLGPTSENENHKTKMQVSSGLLYKSGQPVVAGDVVVRRRLKEDMQDGCNKSDVYDIFDGPWLVCEIPLGGFMGVEEHLYNSDTGIEYQKPGYSTLSKRMSAESGSATVLQATVEAEDKALQKVMKRRHSEIMMATLVKLKFPKGTKANPWTTLGRLIPVTMQSTEIRTPMLSKSGDGGDEDFRMSQNLPVQPAMNLTRVVNKVLHLGLDPFSDSQDLDVGVIELGDQKFMVDYVVPDGVNDDNIYEVDKLRGKRLIRLQGKDAKGEKNSQDPWVSLYSTTKGREKARSVLVAEFLVHWAGWPSEDDSWERGEGNIPVKLIDDYHTKTDPYRGIEDGEGDPMLGLEGMIFEGEHRKGKVKILVSKRQKGRKGVRNKTAGGPNPEPAQAREEKHGTGLAITRQALGFRNSAVSAGSDQDLNEAESSGRRRATKHSAVGPGKSSNTSEKELSPPERPRGGKEVNSIDG